LKYLGIEGAECDFYPRDISFKMLWEQYYQFHCIDIPSMLYPMKFNPTTLHNSRPAFPPIPRDQLLSTVKNIKKKSPLLEIYSYNVPGLIFSAIFGSGGFHWILSITFFTAAMVRRDPTRPARLEDSHNLMAENISQGMNKCQMCIK
jgi:hypothetical protein